MPRHMHTIGTLSVGLCLGTLVGYILSSGGTSSRTTLARYKSTEAPIDVYVQEATTGRIVLGGTVNSDLGVAGQLVIDERL